MGSQYSSKRESFHDAILKKDLKKVKYFIQNGLDVKNDLRALEVILSFSYYYLKIRTIIKISN